MPFDPGTSCLLLPYSLLPRPLVLASLGPPLWVPPRSPAPAPLHGALRRARLAPRTPSTPPAAGFDAPLRRAEPLKLCAATAVRRLGWAACGRDSRDLWQLVGRASLGNSPDTWSHAKWGAAERRRGAQVRACVRRRRRGPCGTAIRAALLFLTVNKRISTVSSSISCIAIEMLAASRTLRVGGPASSRPAVARRALQVRCGHTGKRRARRAGARARAWNAVRRLRPARSLPSARRSACAWHSSGTGQCLPPCLRRSSGTRARALPPTANSPSAPRPRTPNDAPQPKAPPPSTWPTSRATPRPTPWGTVSRGARARPRPRRHGKGWGDGTRRGGRRELHPASSLPPLLPPPQARSATACC
jgi:hypothetical protein